MRGPCSTSIELLESLTLASADSSNPNNRWSLAGKNFCLSWTAMESEIYEEETVVWFFHAYFPRILISICTSSVFHCVHSMMSSDFCGRIIIMMREEEWRLRTKLVNFFFISSAPNDNVTDADDDDDDDVESQSVSQLGVHEKNYEQRWCYMGKIVKKLLIKMTWK